MMTEHDDLLDQAPEKIKHQVACIEVGYMIIDEQITRPQSVRASERESYGSSSQGKTLETTRTQDNSERVQKTSSGRQRPRQAEQEQDTDEEDESPPPDKFGGGPRSTWVQIFYHVHM